MKRKQKTKKESSSPPLSFFLNKPETDSKKAAPPKFDFENFEYQIIIVCEDEKHQKKLMQEFDRRKIKCRPLIL